MTPERWQRVKEILNNALDLDPAKRKTFLAECCAGEPDLKRDVEEFLSSHEEAGSFLQEPVATPVPAKRAAGFDSSLLGIQVGPYRVLREIGRGGMGQVYLAERADDSFQKQVALKVVRPELDAGHILRRFRHERQVMATLEHPNIARLLDGGTTPDGLPFFVMEYIQGQCIDDYCDTHKLTTVERLRLFRTVCAAVQCAHEQLIIHRDIKPGNILINGEGVPKLLDFGIAKILNPAMSTDGLDQTATIMQLMTPEYASPEQVRGDQVGVATDVYSLGVLLYELLTGHRPYRLAHRVPHEVAEAICEQEPERPSTAVNRIEVITRGNGDVKDTVTPESVSQARSSQPAQLRKALCGDLDNIVLMALRKEQQRRYASVREFSDDIQRHLDGLTVRARKDTVQYRYSKWVRRNRAAVFSVAVAICIFVGLTAARLAWSGFRGTGARDADVRISPFTTLPGHESQPAFSPDGKSLAFVWTGEQDQNSDVYVQPVSGGSLVRLTTNPAQDASPVWSPDGKEIAFLRKSREETSIYVTPAGGGQHSRIADLSARLDTLARDLDWSRDGRFLAAGDRDSPDDPFSIVLIGLADGRKRKITVPPRGYIGDVSPAFSPDGTKLAFIRARSSGVDDVYVLPLTGGEPKRITSDNRYLTGLSWTGDSQALMISSERRGATTLWRVPTGRGVPERVVMVGENTSDPAVSRDGRLLAYSHFVQDANIWQIELGPEKAGGRPVKLISSTQFDSSPQFSPDGNRIAFRSNRSGTHEIWTCAIDGSGAAQLTHINAGLTGTPRWSPDGRFIAFDSRPEGEPDIYIVPAQGGNAIRLTTETSEDVVPSWSRDGKWIYFASKRSGTWQVWKKAPFENGPATQVTEGGGFASFESPDGKTLFYAKGRTVGGLWKKPVQGGEETPVMEGLKPGLWGNWAITEKGIYYIDRPLETSHVLPNQRVASPRAQIQFLGFGLTQPKHIATLEAPPAFGDAGLAVSPDGRTVLYSQLDRSESDIMLAANGVVW